MDDGSIRAVFSKALDALVEQVKEDRSILAAILCGSLSHDTVWEKSDIDLALVTVDDKKIAASDVALNADGVNIHAFMIPRTEFRQTVEGATRNSFVHSLLAKGRLLYSHDPTIDALCASLSAIGERDTEWQLLRAAAGTLPAIDKAHKWFVTRADLDYTALWILYAATGLARIEILGRRLLADREVLPQALSLNPAFFKTIYTDLLNARKTKDNVQAALGAVDGYIGQKAPTLFRPIIDYLRAAGDVRSSSEIEAHFKRSADVSGVTIACEYLAHRGLIGKASAPVRLTKRSNVDVQELAFYALDPSSDAVQDW
jgi:Polymerase beta, Nucleotidyltransferase